MKIQYPPNSCGRFFVIITLAFTAAVTARANYTNTVLLDNPLAFYPINSDVDPTGTTATDLSGNGNNGTYNGVDPEFNSVPGPSAFIPNALQCDGVTGSFVELSLGSDPTLLNFSGPITMEAWVQPASPTVGSGPPADIFAKGYDGTNEMTLRANGGYYYGGTYSDVTASGSASGGLHRQLIGLIFVSLPDDGTNWNLYADSSWWDKSPASGAGRLILPLLGQSGMAQREPQGAIRETCDILPAASLKWRYTPMP